MRKFANLGIPVFVVSFLLMIFLGIFGMMFDAPEGFIKICCVFGCLAMIGWSICTIFDS